MGRLAAMKGGEENGYNGWKRGTRNKGCAVKAKVSRGIEAFGPHEFS